jgi:hypothetical protein
MKFHAFQTNQLGLLYTFPVGISLPNLVLSEPLFHPAVPEHLYGPYLAALIEVNEISNFQ